MSQVEREKVVQGLSLNPAMVQPLLHNFARPWAGHLTLLSLSFSSGRSQMFLMYLAQSKNDP